MTKLITAFGTYLYFEKNASEELLQSLPDKGLIKKILPVGYFKKDFLKPIKRYNPNKIICLGIDEDRKQPYFETIAKNEMITIKNPIVRFLATIYSHLLRFIGKNLRIKKQPRQNQLTVLRIDTNHEGSIRLHTKPPKLKGINISKDAGYYVCNYTMWIIEDYLQKNNIQCEFYYIHIPQIPTNKQKEDVKHFILNI